MSIFLRSVRRWILKRRIRRLESEQWLIHRFAQDVREELATARTQLLLLVDEEYS